MDKMDGMVVMREFTDLGERTYNTLNYLTSCNLLHTIVNVCQV